MPNSPTEVTTDDLFDVLARLGCPTVFLGDGDPGPGDMPQLIGALSAAVDQLALAQVLPETARMRAWAAGYLQTQGAGTPCGDRTSFDLLTVRLQMFEVLVEGYRTRGPLGSLLRALLGAASCYAVAAATAHAVSAGVLDGNAEDVRDLSRRQIGEGRALVAGAAALEERLRAALRDAERTANW